MEGLWKAAVGNTEIRERHRKTGMCLLNSFCVLARVNTNNICMEHWVRWTECLGPPANSNTEILPLYVVALGGAFGDSCLCKRNPRELSCPLSAMLGYSEILATWKGPLTRTWPWGYTDLGLLDFRIVRNTFWLFISHPVYSSLLHQLQQTDTEITWKGSSKHETVSASPNAFRAHCLGNSVLVIVPGWGSYLTQTCGYLLASKSTRIRLFIFFSSASEGLYNGNKTAKRCFSLIGYFYTLLCCLGTNTKLHEAFWSVSGRMKEKYSAIVEALAVMRPRCISAYSLGLIHANSSLSLSAL